jgi:uncharacterized protein (TIGR02145 family)
MFLIYFVSIISFLASCSGNFEPISYDNRTEATVSSSSSELDGSSSSSLSSSTEQSSSSNFKEVSSSSSLGSSTEQSSSSSVIEYGSVQCGGHNYKTVVIGTQTWMAENLNYDIGTNKCYNNVSTNCDRYGRLYDWETADKVCPSGWHLPSNEDWDKLMRYADGTSGTASPYESELAGDYLKAGSGRGWNGKDVFGFSALPGGYSYSNGSFSDVGVNGFWWSSTLLNGNDAYYRYMSNSVGTICNNINKRSFLSVRCVKD